ncbi:hypothetical protein NP493_5g15000 [Ridgeia piscesae]|uniref:Reelin domain-containing protein n=1 Tax=Ridgeia piscesae TaxID=27915 RepID=A0AAD9ULG1_RIDPI|nr:hypothetical protein NP493_5g15000 [Ridgeia piscesae]
MYSSEYIAWLVLLVLPAAQGYGSGAPNGMCYSSNMQPMHYLPYDPKPNARNGLAYPQTTDSPYSLTLEDGATTYAPGQTLKVCVTGQPFQGIFMQMRAISEYASVGSFETTLPSNTKLKKCTRDNDSVTHSNTNIKDNPTCFVWKAPDNEERVLRFVATVALTKYTYWVSIKSDVITAAKLTSVDMTSSTIAMFTSAMTSSTVPKLTSDVNHSPAVTYDTTTHFVTSGTTDNTSDVAFNVTDNEGDTNGANSPGVIFITIGVCALLPIIAHVLG